MFHWFKQMWLGSEPVAFDSSFGLQESVERLKAATRRSVFSALAQSEAVGIVKASHVSLQRVIPMVGNSFKPFFRGRFVEVDGKVVLSGRFTMHWFVKVFMGVWFGGIACFTVLTALGAAIRPHQANATALFGMGMIAAGLGVVGLGQWFSRNDAAWLSDVIRRALSAAPPIPASPAGAVTGNVSPPPRPSMAMTVVAAVLALFGLVSLGLAISGVQSAYTGPHGWMVTHVDGFASRYVGAAYGAMLLVLAYGIYRRLLLAWRAGLALLAVAWAYSLIHMLIDADMPKGGVPIILFGIASLLVVIYWGRWWYAQRIHFYN